MHFGWYWVFVMALRNEVDSSVCVHTYLQVGV
jgi:hypothetical protein